MNSSRTALALLALSAALILGGALGAPAPIRAAYFYGDMAASHVDSLAAWGFDRALVKFSADSLDATARNRLRAFAAAAARTGVVLVPSFNLQSRARLTALGTLRRYTWGRFLKVEPELACPLDSAYWRSALVDHAEEILAVVPGVTRLLLDAEIYFASVHHYDRGPCRCPRCITEYVAPAGGAGFTDRELPGLHAWEEVRLMQILTPMLAEFAARHPGVELGVFDLDYDSFVHRALARALARSKVPAANYCEKTYAKGAAGLDGVRGRLAALGLGSAPVIGGLWLQKWTPERLGPAIAEMNRATHGYFIFTSLSLWFDPSKLTGPYTLQGTQADYRDALRRANPAP